MRPQSAGHSTACPGSSYMSYVRHLVLSTRRDARVAAAMQAGPGQAAERGRCLTKKGTGV